MYASFTHIFLGHVNILGLLFFVESSADLVVSGWSRTLIYHDGQIDVAAMRQVTVYTRNTSVVSVRSVDA